MEDRRVKRYIKKIPAACLIFCLALTLPACASSSKTDSQAKNEKTQAEDTKDTQETKKEAEKSEIPANLMPQGTTGQSGNNSDTGKSRISDEQKAGTYDAAADTDEKAAKNAASSKPSKKNSVSGSDEKNTVQVTVSVDCSAAVKYGMEVTAVPMKGKKVTLQKGQTVYDALVASGISFSGSSGYISGIAGVYEKNCGPASGWTYYVNGKMPNTGSAGYTCKDGDRIQWKYVTE